MDNKLNELIKVFNEKLEIAQSARSELLNYLEDEYNVNIYEEAETIEDNCDWCYGVDVAGIQKAIDRSNKE